MHKQDGLKILLLTWISTNTRSCVFIYCTLELIYVVIHFSFKKKKRLDHQYIVLLRFAYVLPREALQTQDRVLFHFNERKVPTFVSA